MFLYDVEVKYGVPPKNPADRVEGIIYCNGWTNHAGMGIACVCVYDYTTDKYHVFDEHDLDELQELIRKQDIAVGFNSRRFDNAVLRAAGIEIDDNRCYDILEQIQNKVGKYTPGCKLDDVVKANFPNAGKSGNGADAPIWWQQGKYARVINYCLCDVRVSKMLLDKILRFGFINNPVNPATTLRINRP